MKLGSFLAFAWQWTESTKKEEGEKKFFVAMIIRKPFVLQVWWQLFYNWINSSRCLTVAETRQVAIVLHFFVSLEKLQKHIT